MTIWCCPNRRGMPAYEGFAAPPQWVIGYSYFGGLATWTTPAGNFTGRSPIKPGTARRHWVLAADALIKMGPTTWAENAVMQNDPRYFIYANCPPHKKGRSPAGGNELFADGSGGWRNFDSWYRFTFWIGACSPQTFVYWSQETTDFEPALITALSSLKQPTAFAPAGSGHPFPGKRNDPITSCAL